MNSAIIIFYYGSSAALLTRRRNNTNTKVGDLTQIDLAKNCVTLRTQISSRTKNSSAHISSWFKNIFGEIMNRWSLEKKKGLQRQRTMAKNLSVSISIQRVPNFSASTYFLAFGRLVKSIFCCPRFQAVIIYLRPMVRP